METTDKKLDRFLNLYWLRPENGLLCTFKSLVCIDVEFTRPSLDVSCGDGMFMFLHLGGELGEDFDYFRATRAGEFSHSKFIDIYNTFERDYRPTITAQAKTRIDVGTDWKQGLLDKAGALGLYDKLVQHDNNQVPLPLPDNYFSTVYSNSIYWVKDVEALLAEIHRVMKPGGRAVLEVKTPYLLDTLDRLGKHLSPEAVSILDRNRRATMPGSRTYRQWRDVMDGAGFRVEDARSVYPNRILVDIWNVGLRPVSHLLIQMADNLKPDDRLRIKREWVEIFSTLFRPLLDLPPDHALEQSPYLCFLVRK
ncbi:MAG: methyltransferase domain-containing protein [Candidatus Glassbacteria bacterium]